MKKTDIKYPFKVLQLVDSFEMAGAQTIIYNMALKGDNKKYKTVVCGWREAGDYYPVFLEKGIDTHVMLSKRRSIFLLPLFLYDIFKIVFCLFRFIRQNDVDIIHAHLVESSIFAVLLGKLTKKPVVITIHNNYILPMHRKRSIRNRLRKITFVCIFCMADRLLAVGEDVKESLKKFIGDKRPIITLFNGVDCEKFKETSNHADIRKRFNILQNSKVICCVGRFSPEKAHIYLIRAASELIKKFPYVRILLVGDGPLIDDYKKEVKERGLTGTVSFLGIRQDVPDILSISDVFALPSNFEGIPLVALEAMASEKPVVATDIMGTREVLSNGVEGFLVEPENEFLLAERITALLSDSALAVSMGKKGREKVEKLFSADGMVKKTATIYEKVLGVLND